MDFYRTNVEGLNWIRRRHEEVRLNGPKPDHVIYDEVEVVGSTFVDKIGDVIDLETFEPKEGWIDL